MKKRFGLFISMVLVSMLVIAACGGDDDNGNGNGDNGGGNGGGDSVDMEMDEMFFDPDTITASAGSTYTVNLENVGTQLHDFTIDDLGGEEVHVEVEAGESGTAELSIPDETGEWDFYCSVPGHREAGMEGVLTVE